MLTADYTNILLDLKDALVTNIITTDRNITIFIEQERMPHRCPDCSAITERVHDYRYQKVKDISIQEKRAVLVLRKRRYVCGTCRKRFLEKNQLIGKYQRMTQRLQGYLLSLSQGDGSDDT